jgi:DNA-binding transcriptional LysR family regulator
MASTHTRVHTATNRPSHGPIAWDDAQIFLAVADAGSLSGAAKRLRVTQPTVSRRVAFLEASLGEAVFVRSAEGVTLTSFGERLLEPARRMAEWASELDRAAERAETTPRGSVRLTAPPGIAFDFLVPFAAWLPTRLPDVTLEIRSTIELLDLSRRDADLALRFAPPVQRDLVSLAAVELEVGAFASEAYARTLPKRCRLSDVRWIGWAPPFENVSPNPELARLIPGWRPAFASDDFLVQLRAAELGVGAIFLGRAQHRFSGGGPIVEIDVDVGEIRRTLHLVGARGALEIPRVRAVADLLVADLGATVARKKKRR